LKSKEGILMRRTTRVAFGFFVFTSLTSVLFLSPCFAAADIAVIVNPANHSVWKKDEISTQIKDLFLSKRERFPDGTSAKTFDQPPGEALRTEFYSELIGLDETGMNSYWSNLIFTGNGRPPKVVGGDHEVMKAIKENVGGIGYIDAKTAPENVKVIYVLKSK
jgi:ABC-type phosphate transport system substrate-binding protein